jgi:hypothetical protein
MAAMVLIRNRSEATPSHDSSLTASAGTGAAPQGQMVKGHTGGLRRSAFGLEGRGSLINIARSFGPFEPLAAVQPQKCRRLFSQFGLRPQCVG